MRHGLENAPFFVGEFYPGVDEADGQERTVKEFLESK